MCHFMNKRLTKASKAGLAWCFLWQISFVICDTSNVLHSSEVELGTEDLVILGKWICTSEEIAVELQALLSPPEQCVFHRFQIFNVGATGIKAKRYARLSSSCICKALIWSSAYSKKICRHSWSTLEFVVSILL